MDEKFEFTARSKKNLLITAGVGILLVILGILTIGGHNGAEAETSHHAFHWTQRLFADLWINNVYFTGIAIIGVFFLAIQYAAEAGWSAYLKRIPEAFGYWLPFAFILMIGVFYIASHDLFHWTHETLYIEFLDDGSKNPEYDHIIAGKEPFLNTTFYLLRMGSYFAIWFFLFWLIRRESLAEDLDGKVQHWHNMVKYSAIFIVFFAVSSSVATWDWILSIDTHWFSTLIGWYVFASWFVCGLAVITLIVINLKENGYLEFLTPNHLHDMGKFIFAFSIFWTYLWVSQFLLIYYANLPEETIYYYERINSDFYAPFFYVNLLLNFFFPFLALMTRDSKRHTIILKIVCVGVLIGHWLDFYLMVTPGVLKGNGGFGFMEIGVTLIYLAAFLFVVLSNLAKVPLIAKNHPMMEESLHHHI